MRLKVSCPDQPARRARWLLLASSLVYMTKIDPSWQWRLGGEHPTSLPGSRLPTESEVAGAWEVARITAQRPVALLREERSWIQFRTVSGEAAQRGGHGRFFLAPLSGAVCAATLFAAGRLVTSVLPGGGSDPVR